jgi:hypothetical protein
MLNKIKKILGLTPKVTIQEDDRLKISVGIVNNKLIIKLDKSVDTITFTKDQLSQFLAAVAGQMGQLK